MIKFVVLVPFRAICLLASSDMPFLCQRYAFSLSAICLLSQKTMQKYGIPNRYLGDGGGCRAIAGLFFEKNYGSPNCSTMAFTSRGVNALLLT